jgi:hypothetical protein
MQDAIGGDGYDEFRGWHISRAKGNVSHASLLRPEKTWRRW